MSAQRLLRAQQQPISIIWQEHRYLVRGATANEYVVTMSEKEVSCTCPDHMYRNETCKHILHCALQRHTEKKVCPYGVHCIRQNLAHKMHFIHPEVISVSD